MRRRRAVGSHWRRLAVLLLLPIAGCAAPPLRVMSFNVRYASDTPPHEWAARRPAMVAVIAHAKPDVIGTQELLQRQGDDLVAALPGYRWFGRDRRGGHGDEHMGIFYNPDRLRVVRQGDFWLSETPDVPGSVAWGADYPRMANWAVFETLGASPRRFLFVDTHLAHRDQDEDARERQVALILSRLPGLARGMPVVLAGDMNARPDSGTYRLLAGTLTDARAIARRRSGPEKSFHDFTGVADRRLDYLFVRGFTVREYATDDAVIGGAYPSDHFPVRATLDFARR